MVISPCNKLEENTSKKIKRKSKGRLRRLGGSGTPPDSPDPLAFEIWTLEGKHTRYAVGADIDVSRYSGCIYFSWLKEISSVDIAAKVFAWGDESSQLWQTFEGRRPTSGARVVTVCTLYSKRRMGEKGSRTTNQCHASACFSHPRDHLPLIGKAR
ncbi:hypothetical protein LZ30DRAFT_35308 [Colletotrichum cereale]|nr:hypothetical protein LZ30DRAFT_35308 [Colletotrichum cereale]